MKGCKICHSLTAELDENGRCGCCADVLAASVANLSYGKYMALKRKEMENKRVSGKQHENVCAYCGKPILEGRKRKYCGRHCREQANYRNLLEENGVLEMEIAPRICDICGKEFYPKRRNSTAKRCSDECKYEYNLRKNRANWQKLRALKEAEKNAEN